MEAVAVLLSVDQDHQQAQKEVVKQHFTYDGIHLTFFQSEVKLIVQHLTPGY